MKTMASIDDLLKAIAVCEQPPYDSRLSFPESIYKLHDFWPRVISVLKPVHAVELGTGAGRTASLIMAALPATSKFTTVNVNEPKNSNIRYGYELDGFRHDHRLLFVRGDSRDPKVREQVKQCQVCNTPRGKIDLLFIDSEHKAHIAYNEFRLFEPILNDICFVFVDDLPHHDMIRFWDAIPYHKRNLGGHGVFIYTRTPFLSWDIEL